MKVSKEHLAAIAKARGPGTPDLAVDPDDPWYKPSPPEYYTSFEPGDIVMMGKVDPDDPPVDAVQEEKPAPPPEDSKPPAPPAADAAFEAAHRRFFRPRRS